MLQGRPKEATRMPQGSLKDAPRMPRECQEDVSRNNQGLPKNDASLPQRRPPDAPRTPRRCPKWFLSKWLSMSKVFFSQKAVYFKAKNRFQGGFKGGKKTTQGRPKGRSKNSLRTPQGRPKVALKGRPKDVPRTPTTPQEHSKISKFDAIGMH